MSDKEKKSLEEWLEEERARLDEGFSYTPPEPSSTSSEGTAEDVLAGLGIGAGVAGGAVASHDNPVTFEGCPPTLIASALRSEIADSDTQVQIERGSDATTVTVLQTDENTWRATAALNVTLIETGDTLTVSVSELSKEALRGKLGSIGKTLANRGRSLAFASNRGALGLFDAAGNLIQGISEIADDLEDLGLTRRVWAVIDRVGQAAEDAYLEQKRKEEELQRQREAAERAWTRCEHCGRPYAEDEADRVTCASCGAPRGPKPDWL